MPWHYDNLMKMKYGPEIGFEKGMEDPIVKKGRWRLFYPQFPELDLEVYDPPVTDSKTSLIDGVDSSREPGMGYIDRYKGMPYDVWRREVMYKQNPTIKHIYNNWDISPEHPGMKFRSNFRGEYAYPKHQGMMMNGMGYVKNIGGRYHDAPNGEQCLVKAWAPMKLTLPFTIVATINECVAGSRPAGWQNWLKMFFRISYLPMGAAAAWGGTSCMLCAIRKEDDNWNYLWGGIAYGTVFGLRLGALPGFQVGSLAVLLTMGWRLFVDYEASISGSNPMFEGNIGSALARERFEWKSHLRDLPTEIRW